MSDLPMNDRLLMMILITFLANLLFAVYTNWRIDEIVKGLKERLDKLEYNSRRMK